MIAGAAAASRVFNEALAKIAMNAQHGGTTDIGKFNQCFLTKKLSSVILWLIFVILWEILLMKTKRGYRILALLIPFTTFL